MPQLLLLSVVGLPGLMIGSFLNVVIHRVPRGESLVTPGSHCPHCSSAVRKRHNVPVLGWLMLRGKCADCKAPISARYPLVEAATAAFVSAALLTALFTPLGRLFALSSLCSRRILRLAFRVILLSPVRA